MPKIKTKSSAKKRFRITGNGKVKRGFAFKRHLLSHKNTARKRRLRGTTNIHDSDLNSIAKLLPNS